MTDDCEVALVPFLFLIVALFALFMVIIGYTASASGEEYGEATVYQEAVDEGKASWCIENNEKVFKWGECE